MPMRHAKATWENDLLHDRGTIRLGDGTFQGTYSFGTRMQEESGTNPEELIGAAHAGCFSMTLAAGLSKAGFPPHCIATTADIQFDKAGDGSAITKITLRTEPAVPGNVEATFRSQAEATKQTCPVSRA